MGVIEVVFSPTGGTKKVADAIAAGLGGCKAVLDLADADFAGGSIGQGDVAVIAVPSFAGRVPSVAAERLLRVEGSGAFAVLACAYGNRAYEDTLIELLDLSKAAGFRPVAAVAAVAEHSIVRKFATGRPDSRDFEYLSGFTAKALQKISLGDGSEPAVPGNRPYHEAKGVGMVPKATKGCVECGLCARECPVQAIDRESPRSVDASTCISCMRCVAVCPHGARKINPVMIAAAGLALKKACSERKECESYL